MTEAVKRPRGRPKKSEYKDGELQALVPEVPENEMYNEPEADDALGELKKEIALLREEVGKSTPAKKVPDGVWRRDYDAKHMRVHGGVEVRHAAGFRPSPPSSIPMYVAKGGGTTDHIEVPYQDYYEFDTIGNPVIDEETGEQKRTRAPRGKAAMRDEDGNPVLTDEYKLWIAVRSTGERLDGNVMSDIAAGKGIPAGAQYSNGTPDLTTVGVKE